MEPKNILADLLLPNELPAFEHWLQSSEARLRQADELLRGLKLPLWSPLPGPQAVAYHHPADVVGYGGAGGGKTDLALGLALTQHKKSLLLRRELTNTRSMFDRAREILGDRIGRFNESQSTWKNRETSQKIEFAGCSNPGDEQKYRGRPRDFIAFDEADQFPEYVVRFICGWLRTTVFQQRCRVLFNFNPPATADGEWLLEYFGP